MPDAVDAAVDLMQPAAPHTAVDSSPAGTELDELSTGDDAVLALGYRRNRGIDSASPPLIIYMNVKGGLAFHNPSLAGKSRRRTPRS